MLFMLCPFFPLFPCNGTLIAVQKSLFTNPHWIIILCINTTYRYQVPITACQLNGLWHSRLHKYVSKYKYAFQLSQILHILKRETGVLLARDDCEVFYFLISYSVCISKSVKWFFPLSKSFKDFRRVFILDFVPSQKRTASHLVIEVSSFLTH